MPTGIALPPNLQVVFQYVLSHEISALALIASDDGHAVAGSLTHLPTHAKLDGFGKFFDERSLLVRFNGELYLVFKQDLFDCSEVLPALREGREDPNHDGKRPGATG